MPSGRVSTDVGTNSESVTAHRLKELIMTTGVLLHGILANNYPDPPLLGTCRVQLPLALVMRILSTLSRCRERCHTIRNHIHGRRNVNTSVSSGGETPCKPRERAPPSLSFNILASSMHEIADCAHPNARLPF